MAKPRKNKNGIFTVMVCYNHRRRNLTLGQIDRTAANQFAANLECLVSHRKHNNSSKLPFSIDSWIQTLSLRHREQLGQLGLISEFDSSLTVGRLITAFLQEYASRPNDEIKASSKTQFNSAMKHRIPDKLKRKRLTDIEPKKESHRPHAKPVFSKEAVALFRSINSWQREHYSKASWSRANGRLREIGKWAVDNGICDFNPFSLLPSPGEVNERNNVFVEREWVEDAIDQCLDSDTRLLFILGRYAGFRLPSEARTLKWSHVEFNKSKLHVFDSKKRKFRVMPLFDRIREELIRHQKSVKPDRFVLSERCRANTDTNNYNLMTEAIRRTEYEVWVRMRQNLRASCENDLLNQGFDERLVTLWLGHTISVSRKHYQKAIDSDYPKAVAQSRQSPA